MSALSLHHPTCAHMTRQCRSAAQNVGLCRASQTRRAPRSEGVSVPISLETAPGSGRPKAAQRGPVFIAALKQGSVFILGGIHSAFRVKCKRADVFSYYPPQGCRVRVVTCDCGLCRRLPSKYPHQRQRAGGEAAHRDERRGGRGASPLPIRGPLVKRSGAPCRRPANLGRHISQE